MTLVSLIEGINDEVANVIVSEVGADSFRIDRVGPLASVLDEQKSRSNPRITLDDQDALQRLGVEFGAVMAEANQRGEVRYRGEVLESVSIQGVTSEFYRFSTFDSQYGRLMTPSEVTSRQNVALLGSDTADRLFAGADPIDRNLKVEGVHFRVVGVSKSKGSMFGRSQDEFVVIPLGAFQRLFGNRTSLTLNVRPADPTQIERTMGEAAVALRVERRLRAREDDNFGMFTADTALDIYNQATTGIFAVLIGVVGLALLVAGIVIMNIMLMAVSERTREIGLRKALGAKRRDIMWQMMSESVVLSLLGGLLGTLVGTIAALAIDRYAPVPASIHLWSVMLAIGMTAVVGLFFGLYPASRAAGLDPIDALGRST